MKDMNSRKTKQEKSCGSPPPVQNSGAHPSILFYLQGGFIHFKRFQKALLCLEVDIADASAFMSFAVSQAPHVDYLATRLEMLSDLFLRNIVG